MKDNRPVNLDLTTVRFPITAIASISHRICGVISWVGLGFYLLLIGYAQSPSGRLNVENAVNNNFIVQFIIWGLLTAFAYYCLATAKHIVQEIGYCEDFEGGKMLSWVAIIGAAVISVIIGASIWL